MDFSGESNRGLITPEEKPYTNYISTSQNWTVPPPFAVVQLEKQTKIGYTATFLFLDL